MFYERIFRELSRRRIKYLVVGGVAVNLHGYPRLTGDLDILLSLGDLNIRKYIRMVQSLGFKPRIPVEVEDLADKKIRRTWIREKGLKVFSVYNPKNSLETVDVLLDSTLNFEKAYKSRKIVMAGGIRVCVVSIDDLIVLKKKAGRTRDELDIGALKRLKGLLDGR